MIEVVAAMVKKSVFSNVKFQYGIIKRTSVTSRVNIKNLK